MSSHLEVFVDPEELRSFSRQLDSYAKFVESSAGRINGLMKRLGEYWTDGQFREFDEQFQAAQRLLKKFSAEVDRTVPKLDKDAEMAERIRAEKLHL